MYSSAFLKWLLLNSGIFEKKHLKTAEVPSSENVMYIAINLNTVVYIRSIKTIKPHLKNLVKWQFTVKADLKKLK